MATTSWISGARVLAAACLLVGLDAYGQTPTVLLDTVHTVAAPTVAVPIEQTINITSAGTYQVTLNDIGAQLTPAAPVASVGLAISSGSALVNLTAVGNATTRSNTQLVGTGSVTFNAPTTGDYVFHLTGAPSSNPASGQINVSVTPTASGGGTTPNPAGFNGVLQLPPSNVQHNVGVLNDSIKNVPTTGSYVVTLTDMQLPTALTTLQLYIATASGTIVTPTTFATSAGNPVATATVTLQAGVTYGIYAGGQAGGSVNAGLYGVNVTPSGGGAPLYQNTIQVGSVVALGSPALSAANYTVSLTDLAYPTALSQLGVVVALNGQSVAQLAATGTSTPFAATANPYQVFAVGVASGSQGSYTVSVQPAGGTPILSAARAVTDPATGVFAYSFDTTTVGSETYNFDLADFGYPAAFSSLKGVAVQSGAQLGTVDSSGTTSGTKAITPAAGPVTLLVFAQPVAPTGGGTAAGLFGLDLIASGAGAQFETSQGVGQLFSVQKVTVSEGGPYQAVVADLGFPGNFATLGVVVTRGTSKIGSIFGGGTLPFNAIGGDYLVNFVAEPDTTDQAGTYSIVVEQAPQTATATLQVSPTTVAPGGTVTLKWSSSNVSSCTGTSTPAGAWPGTIGTGGNVTSAALNATTTFTYTCVGNDGTKPAQTVTVTVTSNTTGGGHGGGGSISVDVLAVLLGLFVLRGLSRRTYRC